MSRTLTFSGIKAAFAALMALATFLAAFFYFIERGLETFLATILDFFNAFFAALAEALLAAFA